MEGEEITQEQIELEEAAELSEANRGMTPSTGLISALPREQYERILKMARSNE